MTSENDLSNFTKYTEQQLKKYAKNKLSFPDLEDYIKKQYYHDIYYCFFQVLSEIQFDFFGFFVRTNEKPVSNKIHEWVCGVKGQ